MNPTPNPIRGTGGVTASLLAAGILTLTVGSSAWLLASSNSGLLLQGEQPRLSATQDGAPASLPAPMASSLLNAATLAKTAASLASASTLHVKSVFDEHPVSDLLDSVLNEGFEVEEDTSLSAVMALSALNDAKIEALLSSESMKDEAPALDFRDPLGTHFELPDEDLNALFAPVAAEPVALPVEQVAPAPVVKLVSIAAKPKPAPSPVPKPAPARKPSPTPLAKPAPIAKTPPPPKVRPTASAKAEPPVGSVASTASKPSAVAKPAKDSKAPTLPKSSIRFEFSTLDAEGKPAALPPTRNASVSEIATPSALSPTPVVTPAASSSTLPPAVKPPPVAKAPPAVADDRLPPTASAKPVDARNASVVASSPDGSRVWLRLGDFRTVIIDRGQTAPGLGVFKGVTGSTAQFASGNLPIN